MEALTEQITVYVDDYYGETETRTMGWFHFYEGDSLMQVNFDAEECHCGCATVPSLLLVDGFWKVGYDCHVTSIEEHFADERTAARWGAW